MKKQPPRRVQRQMKKQADMQTISGLRRLIIQMQSSGAIFLLAGLFLPQISPFYAEKTWKTLFGLKLGLPQMLIVVGCLMLAVSIFCFLRSFRCAKCGGLLALLPYRQPEKCRSCGAKLQDKDVKTEFKH